MTMKTRMKRDARLLALLALLAVLPLGVLGCDAGDSPGAPTGPAAQYNPDIDYPGATITAVANRSSVAPGGDFGIIATIKDANGMPIEGVPLVVSAEMGGAAGYFDFQTNPTLTDGSGKASIGVVVSAGCPAGSYRFMIAPLRGPTARGYVGVTVGGTGGGGTEAITSVALTTSTPSVVAGNAANFNATPTGTPECTEAYFYQAVGAGLSTDWLNLPQCAGSPSCNFAVTPTSPGTVTVQVAASCTETDRGAWSPTVSVTVTAVAPSDAPSAE
jgi:hypothetical protein